MKNSIVKIATMFFLFIQLKTIGQTGIYVPELADFDTAMENLIEEYYVPGAALAITYEGRLVYNRGFGYADTATHTLVQPEHIFRLASVSKPITAVSIMYLVEQGLLDLKDTVFGATGILNDAMYATIYDPRVYDITVRNLLNHSGGCDRDISGDPVFNSYAIATAMGTAAPADAVTVIQYVIGNQMLDFSPGTQYGYSNLGYSILGRVIEKVTGQNYADYVHNTILFPLDISEMNTGFNMISNQLPMEVTYYDYPGSPLTNSVYDDVTLVPWPYGGYNIEALDALGGWVASAADLCKFLVAIDGFSTKPDILLPATIDTMIYPSATNPNYALGWFVNEENNYWHGGSLPGTITDIVRGNNQLNWAMLLNTRPYDASQLYAAMDALVWDILPTITTWPSLDLFTGVAEYANDQLINIYPNPTDGIFTISSSEYMHSVEIYNIQGGLILQQNLYKEINLSGFPNGMYIVKIYFSEKVHTEKIVLK